MDNTTLNRAVENPELERAKNSLRWRCSLRGAAIGIVVGVVACILIVGGNILSSYLQAEMDAPRRQAFLSACAHPIASNPETFSSEVAHQGECQILPGKVKIKYVSPYHDTGHWSYWLTIGPHTFVNLDGTKFSHDPNAIGYQTNLLHWKDDKPFRVNALFWNGLLMSISSEKYGYSRRIQTLANPTTSWLDYEDKKDDPSNYFTFFVLVLAGALMGFPIGSGSYFKSDLYLNSLPQSQSSPESA